MVKNKMDLWNNEIVSHALSSRRGDRMTYISGLKSLLALKQRFPEHEMILHSDQGAVYSSKKYNELLPMYNVIRSMSRAGTPTDNAAMEAINGWIKAELDGNMLNGGLPLRVVMCLSEHPFGTVKWYQGAHYLLCRGKTKAAGELGLSFLAYNLTRAINIVGVRKLIAAM